MVLHVSQERAARVAQWWGRSRQGWQAPLLGLMPLGPARALGSAQTPGECQRPQHGSRFGFLVHPLGHPLGLDTGRRPSHLSRCWVWRALGLVLRVGGPGGHGPGSRSS